MRVVVVWRDAIGVEYDMIWGRQSPKKKKTKTGEGVSEWHTASLPRSEEEEGLREEGGKGRKIEKQPRKENLIPPEPASFGGGRRGGWRRVVGGGFGGNLGLG